MTDKEIIIDGVNVAGCELLDGNYCKLCDMKAALDELIVHRQYCDRTVNKNCYYKQLKRLEQENAELKAENERLRTCIDTQRIDETNQYIKKVNFERENYKLKSTLQEIKAIANTRFVNGLNEEADIYNADMDRILDLITKIESEDE